LSLQRAVVHLIANSDAHARVTFKLFHSRPIM
jgi:hypothetical protein